MAIFGWDASHYDWDRGPMDVGAAVRDGIQFMTHKAGEGAPGFFADPYLGRWWQRARDVVPVPGAYYVNHPGDQIAQADRFLALLDAGAPGWRDRTFVLQVDAEKFDYMTRAPSLSEIRTFCGRLVERTGGRNRPIVYAPKWLYGDNLTGLAYPLWASDYGANPALHYRAAYPGDGSSRWGSYSGQTPVLLQYGSRTTIGTQTGCDANAYRGTLDQLRALATGAAEVPLTPVTQPTPSAEEDNMFHGQVPAGQQPIIVCTPWNKSSISFGCDFGKAKLRIAEHEVNVGWHVYEIVIDSADRHRYDLGGLSNLRANIDRRSIMRLPLDANDKMTTPVGYLAWWT